MPATDSWAMTGHGSRASDRSVPEVKVMSREMVLPSTPSPPHPFFLSCLDLFWQRIHYNRRLLFYHSPDFTGQSVGDGRRSLHQIQQLKSSLSNCLVHYYCWCGRIAKGADPPHRLFIDCNDAGVEFLEASIDIPLSLLAKDGFQMKPFFDELCQKPDHEGDSLFSSPLLSIQATFFEDGGLVLGIAQSHIVADGQSLWDFMVSWGECSRGVPLSLPPLHDRQRLAVPDPSSEKARWTPGLPLSKEDEDEAEAEAEEEDISTKSDLSTDVDNDKSESSTDPMTVDKERGGSPVPAGTSEEQGDGGMKATSDSRHSEGSNPSANDANCKSNGSNSPVNDANGKTDSRLDSSLTQWMFTLSASAIKKLKTEAGEGCTSFDVTFAHFWKRTLLARKAPSRFITFVAAPVNCRNRWTPPLPRAYFGNVIGFSVMASTVGRICRESFHETASRIHTAVASVTQEFMEGFMHWMETHDNKIMRGQQKFSNVVRSLNVASSPWFPAYEVDFGWGKPMAVRAARVTAEGELVFFGGKPGSNRGDVEICTALSREVLEHLLNDPLFVGESPCPS